MCKCENVQMCKLSPFFAAFVDSLGNVQMLGECANVRMCKCANSRLFLLRL